MKLLKATYRGSSLGAIEKGGEMEAFHTLAKEFHVKSLLNKAQYTEVSFWDDLQRDNYVADVSRYQFHDYTDNQMNDDGYVITPNSILAFYEDVRHPGSRHFTNMLPEFSHCIGFHIKFVPLKIGWDIPRIPKDYTGLEIYQVGHASSTQGYIEKSEFMTAFLNLHQRLCPIKTILTKAQFLSTSFWYDAIEDDNVRRYDNFDLDEMRDDGYIIQPNAISICYPAKYQNAKVPNAHQFTVTFDPLMYVKDRAKLFNRR